MKTQMWQGSTEEVAKEVNLGYITEAATKNIRKPEERKRASTERDCRIMTQKSESFQQPRQKHLSLPDEDNDCFRGIEPI